VFISHSSQDTWIARQLARFVREAGAETFLDETDIHVGDDFEATIVDAARNSHEMLVLLTPWSLKRPYMWMELGVLWAEGRRIVGILHGLKVADLTAEEGTPALLKRIDLVVLNEVDRYFSQLKSRLEERSP
jgi:hypothetical protein